MNLGLARKIIRLVRDTGGDIGINPDDPTAQYFQAKSFFDRNELRLDIRGSFSVGSNLLPGEASILATFAGALVNQLLRESGGQHDEEE
jgi:hypothetical protein